MIARETLLDVVNPLVEVLPRYHPDAADVNEALDDGVASCAAGLLLQEAYPNPNLYDIRFGYAAHHAGDYVGEQGTYVRMGHAVASFCVPGSVPLVIESYTDGSIEVVTPTAEHDSYTWMGLEDGYRTYLAEADLADVEVDPVEILSCLRTSLQNAA